MLKEYEAKRLEYNLALNELNKFKKDYENKIVEMTKHKFDTELKKQQDNLDKLKTELDDIFDKNKEEIAKEMLSEQLDISFDYNFYSDEIIEEDGKSFVCKKNKDDILKDIDLLKDKVQKRYDNKYITKIIYDDLNKCLDIYKNFLLKKMKDLDDKKIISLAEKKEIIKVKKDKNATSNEIFKRLVLPLTVLDIICFLFIFIRGGECSIGSSETMSMVLCSFMIMARLMSLCLTPILIICFIIKGINMLSRKKR